MPVSHRRYDYLRFIYLEIGEEDPSIWYLVEYPDEDEVNPTFSERNLTETMLLFFSATLRNHTASFHFVSEEEENNNPYFTRDNYLNWYKALEQKSNYVDKYQTNNEFIKNLHEIFLTYYLPNKITIKEELSKYDQKEIIEKKTGKNNLKWVQKNENIILKIIRSLVFRN